MFIRLVMSARRYHVPGEGPPTAAVRDQLHQGQSHRRHHGRGPIEGSGFVILINRIVKN
jgi:hypothetical protein